APAPSNGSPAADARAPPSSSTCPPPPSSSRWPAPAPSSQSPARRGYARWSRARSPAPTASPPPACRRSPTGRLALLDRDALGQVPRLIDVVAAGEGHGVGEELQRQDRQQRLQQGRGVGDPEDVAA